MAELDLSPYIKDARQKAALVDTNLLLLLLTVATDPSLLASYKRVQSFTLGDAILLELILAKFHRIVTTSYVLTEVSNLGASLREPLRTIWYKRLAGFALSTEENHIETSRLGNRVETVRFGVADSALSLLAESVVLITADYPLSSYVQSKGGQALNFNNLRPLWMAY